MTITGGDEWFFREEEGELEFMAGERSLIEDSIQPVEVMSVRRRVSQEAGNPLFGISLRITEGPHEGEWLWDPVLLDASKRWVVDKWEAIASALLGQGDGGPRRFAVDDLVGRHCLVRVGRHEYPVGSGCWRNDVRDWLPPAPPVAA